MKLKVILDKTNHGMRSGLLFLKGFSVQAAKNLKQIIIKKIPNFLQIKGIVIFASIFVLFLSMGFANAFSRLLPYHTEKVPEYGGVYREAVTGKFKQFNPLFSINNLPDEDVVSLVFSGLTKVNEKREIVGDLAERWEVDHTGKVYTFYLRPGITWQDGNPLMADDIVFTFTVINDDSVKSPLASDWKNVKVEKVDDRIVKFLLPNPYAPFLYQATTPIISKRIYENVQRRNISISELNQRPIGTGPFAFDDLRRLPNGTEIVTLKRFSGYIGDKPFLDGIQLWSYPSEDQKLDAYAKKQVDGIAEVPPLLKNQFKKFKGLVTRDYKSGAVYTLFMNEKSEILKDKKVRTALSLVVDKEKILENAFGGSGEATNRLIPAGYIGSSGELYKSSLDIDKAVANLKQAGWVKNDEGTLSKNNKVMILRLVAFDTLENRKSVEIIGAALEQLGIRLETHLGIPAELEDSYLLTKDYDLFLTAFSLGFDTDPYGFWHSTQIEAPGLNFSAFNNPEADKLIEGARRAKDASTRASKLKSFENILMSDVPAVFIIHRHYIHMIDDQVKIPKSFSNLIISEPKNRFIGIGKWYMKEKEIERAILTSIK